MQKVGIVTDTVAQLTGDLAQRYSVKVVPASTIYCDGSVYVDGVNISPAEAYNLLAQNPSQFNTSAITPDYFSRAFEEMSNRTAEILCITVSSKISAVYNSAVMASEQTVEKAPGLKIRVFDSMSAAGSEGLIVLAAARAAAQGLDIDRVIEVAERARGESESLFIIDTLKYIYRTGRIPKLVSRGAGALGARPLCRIGRDGTVRFVGLGRSREKGIQKIMEMTRERLGDTSINVVIMHTSAPADAEGLKARVEREFNCHDIFISEFSPAMGYSTGPGVLGIAACPEFDITKR
jgi:DegV family protein with EDD domain